MKKILIAMVCLLGLVGIVYGGALNYKIKLYNQSGPVPVTWDWIPGNSTVTGISVICTANSTCEYAKVLKEPTLAAGNETALLTCTNLNSYTAWTQVLGPATLGCGKETSTFAYTYQAITIPGAGTSKGTVSTGFYLRAVANSAGSVIDSNRLVTIVLWY